MARSAVHLQATQSTDEIVDLAELILLGIAVPFAVPICVTCWIGYCAMCSVDDLLLSVKQTVFGRLAREVACTLVDLVHELSPGLLTSEDQEGRQVLARQQIDAPGSYALLHQQISFFAETQLAEAGEDSRYEEQEIDIKTNDVAASALHCHCCVGYLLAGPLPFKNSATTRPGCRLLIDLDKLCLKKIISCLASRDLAALSSTSKSFLQATNKLRDVAKVQACLAGGFFRSFIKRFPKLQVLKIKDPVLPSPACRFSSSADSVACRFSGGDMQHLASTCQELRELHFEGCSHSLAFRMHTIMKQCKKLKILHFRKCHNFPVPSSDLNLFWGTEISRLEVVELKSSAFRCQMWMCTPWLLQPQPCEGWCSG
jgi:hypothetical protein